MGIIQASKVLYEYIRRDEDGNAQSLTQALKDISLEINAGSFVGILGHNGSGKSTLARHFNALLTPQEGTVIIDGKDTKAQENLLEIRQVAGMVFQNPDNQIVSSVVEEDVAFGPENMGLPSEEIQQRVTTALAQVNMTSHRMHSPSKLSGGQKQRVAIAGTIAMETKCIILDEPTAMLDPIARIEVLDTIHRLNTEKQITIILITHNMEEVVEADEIYIMKQGEIVLKGKPRQVFAQEEIIQDASLQLPEVSRIASELRKYGIELPGQILTRKELVDGLLQLYQQGVKSSLLPLAPTEPRMVEAENQTPLLIADHVTAVYGGGSPFETKALEDVSFQLKEGEFVGLIGHTGSGKSTLIQLLNGLMKPTEGSVYYEGSDIFNPEYDRRKLRTQVGIVFQYPEHQLFEATVLKDVSFGPKNMGLSTKQAQLRAFEALQMMKVESDLYNQSPFELSGGQKRRVAIAGILAMKPKVLILDEPTAGLDPRSREELLDLIDELRVQHKMSVILVSHSMEDVARYAQRLLVMSQGHLVFDQSPREVFAQIHKLEQVGLMAPESAYVIQELKQAGMKGLSTATTLEEAVYEISRQFAAWVGMK